MLCIFALLGYFPTDAVGGKVLATRGSEPPNGFAQFRIERSDEDRNHAKVKKPRAVLLFLLLLIFGFGTTFASQISVRPESANREPSAENPKQTLGDSVSGEEQEHGLSQSAVEVTRVFGFPITNSMIVSWAVALVVIVFAQLATRNLKSIPSGTQNFVEWLVGGLYRFLESIIGPRLTKRTFWFFASIFIFILSANWFGLVPGVGSIGWGHQTTHGFKIVEPLLRGANADVNLTLAMALVFFACWIVWALQEVGPVGMVKELFGPKGDTAGVLKALMIVVFFAAGLLEVISILFRPISLTFRLYGNIFAGENLLEAMAKIGPHVGWLISIPFYFLELLMGLVQALVFMLLTAVFTLLMCQHEETPTTAHG